MADLKEISSDELLNLLGNSGVKIIDVRSPDAYNGWREKGEARGGHIKGAKSLPAKWAGYIDWIEIVRSKGFRPEDRLVIYGYQKKQVDGVADLFRKTGYDNVNVYYSFASEWCADERFPMESLPRYTQLVSPTGLMS